VSKHVVACVIYKLIVIVICGLFYKKKLNYFLTMFDVELRYAVKRKRMEDKPLVK